MSGKFSIRKKQSQMKNYRKYFLKIWKTPGKNSCQFETAGRKILTFRKCQEKFFNCRKQDLVKNYRNNFLKV